MLGHYAVGKALESAGVVSANDMTLEAIACKVGKLDECKTCVCVCVCVCEDVRM